MPRRTATKPVDTSKETGLKEEKELKSTEESVEKETPEVPEDAQKEEPKEDKKEEKSNGKFGVYTKLSVDEIGQTIGGDLVQEFDTREEAEELVEKSRQATGLDRWEIK